MFPIRMTLCALAMFNGNTKALYDYAEQTDLNCDDTTVFDIDHTRRLTPFGKFAPIYCLINASEQRSIAAKHAAMWLNFILQSCKFVSTLLEEPTHQHLSKIIEHFAVERLPCIQSYITRDKISHETEESDFGHSVYPLQFLFNHSCVPNVAPVTCGKQLVMTITRPVIAGEQLFVCYE